MKVIIDRFEKDMAIIEIKEGVFTHMPKILLPHAKEGDVVDIIVNNKETEERKQMVADLMTRAFESESEQ